MIVAAAVQIRLGPPVRNRQTLPDHRWIVSMIIVTDERCTGYSSPGHPQRGPYVLAVEHKDEAKLLGHVGFSPFDDEVEVSYAIAESSRGRGYGTEALVHACNWLADAFAVSRVLALTESANVISRRLLDRASFVRVHEAVMMFQGHEQLVSRYYWHPPGNRSGA